MSYHSTNSISSASDDPDPTAGSTPMENGDEASEDLGDDEDDEDDEDDFGLADDEDFLLTFAKVEREKINELMKVISSKLDISSVRKEHASKQHAMDIDE
jgi:hypothetical protein